MTELPKTTDNEAVEWPEVSNVTNGWLVVPTPEEAIKSPDRRWIPIRPIIPPVF